MALVASCFSFLFLLCLALTTHSLSTMNSCEQDLLEFSLNLEFLEAEFFLYGALGYGIDAISPALANGGVAPTGVKKANLSPITRDIMIQFGYQELGHLRAIQNITGGGIPRPPMDLSSSHFATLMERAMGVPLILPFDPYIDELNFLLSAYMLPIVGLTGYVADFNYINTSKTTTVARLLAGLLGIESGQDSIIRALLYPKSLLRVWPYQYTVADFTNRISNLANSLGHNGIKEAGLFVFPPNRNGGLTPGNILNGDSNFLSFDRSPQEILRILYGTGNESRPGGFFPSGAGGNIARYLRNIGLINRPCTIQDTSGS